MGFTARSILDEIDQVRRGFMFMNSLLGTIGGVSLFVAAMMILNALALRRSLARCHVMTGKTGAIVNTKRTSAHTRRTAPRRHRPCRQIH
jgi:hypothetical protein